MSSKKRTFDGWFFLVGMLLSLITSFYILLPRMFSLERGPFEDFIQRASRSPLFDRAVTGGLMALPFLCAVAYSILGNKYPKNLWMRLFDRIHWEGQVRLEHGLVFRWEDPVECPTVGSFLMGIRVVAGLVVGSAAFFAGIMGICIMLGLVQQT